MGFICDFHYKFSSSASQYYKLYLYTLSVSSCRAYWYLNILLSVLIEREDYSNSGKFLYSDNMDGEQIPEIARVIE